MTKILLRLKIPSEVIASIKENPQSTTTKYKIKENMPRLQEEIKSEKKEN
jgi:hypothetical protein